MQWVPVHLPPGPVPALPGLLIARLAAEVVALVLWPVRPAAVAAVAVATATPSPELHPHPVSTSPRWPHCVTSGDWSCRYRVIVVGFKVQPLASRWLWPRGGVGAMCPPEQNVRPDFPVLPVNSQFRGGRAFTSCLMDAPSAGCQQYFVAHVHFHNQVGRGGECGTVIHTVSVRFFCGGCDLCLCVCVVCGVWCVVCGGGGCVCVVVCVCGCDCGVCVSVTLAYARLDLSSALSLERGASDCRPGAARHVCTGPSGASKAADDC